MATEHPLPYITLCTMESVQLPIPAMYHHDHMSFAIIPLRCMQIPRSRTLLLSNSLLL